MTAATWDRLRQEAAAETCPGLRQVVTSLASEPDPARGLASLLGRMLRPAWLSAAQAHDVALDAFGSATEAVAASMADLDTITRVNFEPGGLLGTWIGGRGFHILAAHRVAHGLWTEGRHRLAMAWKTGAAFMGADIHPAARIGRRVFLDHGIGVVIGETAIIEDDVCLWHGVTLGSTLMQDGDRHPKIRQGAVLGAGTTVLGPIEIGEGAVIAAGSVVLSAVPPHTTVAGNPALPKQRHRHPYGFAPERTPA